MYHSSVSIILIYKRGENNLLRQMYIVPWQTFSVKHLQITFCILELWREKHLSGHYLEIHSTMTV